MRPRYAVLVALLVVLSGCGGIGGTTTEPPGTTDNEVSGETPTRVPTPTQTTTPTRTATPTATPNETCTAPQTETASHSAASTDTPTATPTEQPDIEVEGGSLEFDPDEVWKRVEELTGTSVRPPEKIRIRDTSDLTVSSTASRFERSLGFENTSSSFAGFAALGPDYVILNRSLNSTRREAVLAHEFYHFVYYRENVEPYGDRSNLTYDQYALWGALFEGSPDYIQEAYWREYMDRRGRSPAARTHQEYNESPPTRRISLSRYHFGQRYIADRIDSPRELDEIYENPPRTTEELIHRLPPGSEPPVPLDVTVDTDEWIPTDNDTRGELFVRHTLQMGVDDEAAASAATGWGNDSVVRFDCSGSTGFVWALRWDDAANATEFAETFRDYLDARGTRDGEVWTTDAATFQLYEPDDETVVVAFGSREFVADVSVTGDGDEIAVGAP